MKQPSSDARCTRLAAHPGGRSWKVHHWASVGGVYFASIALIVVAITGSRAVDATLARDSRINAQQRMFNQELVAAIEDLADKSGIVASADFCRVRFHLRFPDGEIPAQPVDGTLESVSHDGNDPKGTGVSSGANRGVLDFGLQQPGRYRLHLQTADRMSLVYEFDVLPGVPVDGVVICPHSTVQPEEGPVEVEIVMDWPAELASDDLLALMTIEPGPFESQAWRWESAPQRPVRAIAPMHVDDEPGEEIIREILLDGVFGNEAQPDVHDGSAVSMPYRYCRIREIMFLQRIHKGRADERWRVLGRLVYGTHQDELDSAACWQAADRPPLYEAYPGETNHWRVTVPQDCIDELMRATRDAGQLN